MPNDITDDQYDHFIQLRAAVQRVYNHALNDRVNDLDDACADYIRARGKYVIDNPIGDCGPNDYSPPPSGDHIDGAAFQRVYDYVVAHARYYDYPTGAPWAAFDDQRAALIAYDDNNRTR